LVVVLVLAASAGAARGETLGSLVNERLARELPVDLGVAKLHLSARLARVELAPDRLTIELPRVLRPGRASVKLTIEGRAPVYAEVTLSRMVELAVSRRNIASGELIAAHDIAIERRAVPTMTVAVPTSLVNSVATRAIPSGAIIATTDVARPRPLARGSEVTVELRRRGVTLRGRGTLEVAARPGEPATVRLAHTRTVVRGTLRSPALLAVEGTP
jgi:flagella basal body P-ring formation protein FlgA